MWKIESGNVWNKSCSISMGESLPRMANRRIRLQKKQLMPLETYLYTTARVREATAQEMRPIKTGKFKDAARGNVKLAVRFMLNNYRLSDNVIAAASYLKGQQQIQAGADGQVCFICCVENVLKCCV